MKTFLKRLSQVVAVLVLSSFVGHAALAADPVDGDFLIIYYDGLAGFFKQVFVGGVLPHDKLDFAVRNPDTALPDLFEAGPEFIANTSTHAITIGGLAFSAITGLQTALDGKASLTHSHVISDVTGLQSSLNGKASSTHSHIISDVTGLQGALDAKFDIPSGTTAQYVRGNGTLATLPTAPAMQFSTSSRSLVTGTGATGFQISSTRNTMVSYAVNISAVATLGASAGGYVTLEIAPTNSATAGDWYEVGTRCRADNAVGLLAVQSTQGNGCTLSTIVPAGYYVKLRSVTVAGTPTFTYISGSETQL